MDVEDLRSAMQGIYATGLKLKPPYYATRFAEMVRDDGPIATAATLLGPPATTLHDGFIALVYDYERPDITLEALALKSEFRKLFSDEQRAIAFERLSQAAPKWTAEQLRLGTIHAP